MRLIYLSPVPWASFSQRPHQFVRWFHATRRAEVLWLDPYPTRFPRLADRQRLTAAPAAPSPPHPPWLRVLRPVAVPIEPVPGSGWLNALFWWSLRRHAAAFVDNAPALLAIGKPSLLALLLLRQLHGVVSLYDAMDDFPAFYTGCSRRALQWREQRLARQVTHLWASSTALAHRWRPLRPDVQLVPNGLDPEVLPPARPPRPKTGRRIFGYVGTIAAWFDWPWVIALAAARPTDTVRLIGPLCAPPPPGRLPPNIELLPPCSHPEALRAMQTFDVGLIPFQRTPLTHAVDPIKYYEYRALGLPVLSTDFGEMSLRGAADHTFLSRTPADIPPLAHRALACRVDQDQCDRFIRRHAWHTRFDAARLD